MTNADLKAMTVTELVENFAGLSVKQNKALLEYELSEFNRLFPQIDAVPQESDGLSEFNRLYWQIDAINEELKGRPEDQRRALLALFNHPDLQVRLNAAKATLAVAPGEARAMLEYIHKRYRGLQGGDAGMCLWNLDRGVFVPK
jgi:hypothetical protein